MNEEQKEQVFEWIKQTVEFGQTHAPLLAEEIVTFGLVSNTLGVAIAALFIAASAWAIRYGQKIAWADRRSDDKLPLYIVGALGAIIGAVLIVDCATSIIKIKTAPRMYILERLAK